MTSIHMSTEIHMERTAWAAGIKWPRFNPKRRFLWNTLYVVFEFKGVNLCELVELTRKKFRDCSNRVATVEINANDSM